MNQQEVSEQAFLEEELAERNPYTSPVLVEYGSLLDLTQGQAGSGFDGGTGGQSFGGF